jgi:hypothetical protein
MNNNPRASWHYCTNMPGQPAEHHNRSADFFAVLHRNLQRGSAAKRRERLGKTKPRRSSRSKDDGNNGRTLGLGMALFS